MSPFEIFRRNLKAAMIVLTLLSIFAFVVLPTVEQYMRSAGGGNVDAQVASFDGVPLYRSRVDNFTRNHNSTVRFLRELAEETIRRGGSPRTPGFVYNSQAKQVQRTGIDENPSPFATVRTLQFSSEAEKAGFVLDDTAVDAWLQQYTDGTMSDAEINSLIFKSSNNSMGMSHLREQLRAQLTAQLYQRGAGAGIVTSQQMPLVTPAQQWTNFLKLNRKATVDAYGVLVQDYYEETDANPTAANIQAVYTEGKDRYPNSELPTPGYKRRETATFEYLVSDLQTFLDEEVAKLSEEEIRAEYDRQVKGGAFQMPENSVEDLLKQAEETKAKIEAEAAAKKAAEEEAADEKETDKPDEKPADAKPEMKEPAENADPKPAADDAKPAKDADAKPADDKKAEAKKTAEAPAAAKVEMKKDAEPTVAATPAKSDAKPNKPEQKKAPAAKKPKKKKERTPLSDADAKAAKEQVDSFLKEIESVKEELKEPAADQSRVSSSNGVRLVLFQDDEKEKADAEDTEPEVADDTKPADDKKADEPKADEAPAEDAKPEEKPAPKVEKFEDVRKQVAESMVREKASTRSREAVAKVMDAMRRYSTQRMISEGDEMPAQPDLKKLADELGLKYAKIGPHDIVSLKDEPIAQSVEMRSAMTRNAPPFTAMMYGVESQGIPKKELFSPLGTVDFSNRTYVSWKTEEKEAYTPELEECRDEVIKSIRMNEARDLARAAADKLVERVAAGESLDEVIPEEKKFNYKKDLGPFSWMNSFGFQGATLGNVPQLDSVGEEFMGKVFSTKPGELGVAANLPERAVYIVKPKEFQPSVDELREQFKQPMARMMTMTLGSEDAGSIYQGFYEEMDERTGFNFESEDDQ